MLRQVIVAGMLIGLMFIAVSQVRAQLEFGAPELMGPNINEDGHNEASPSLSHDGLELFFSKNQGSIFLYSARRDNKEGEFGPRQTIGSGKNPSISADGLSLYFASGGLWVMTRDTIDSQWDRGRAERVAPDFWTQRPPGGFWNQPGISADGLELYFTSAVADDGSIWVTNRETDDSPWEEPVKLGPHINATIYDASAQTSADGLTLLFKAWQRPGGFGDWDIWMANRETIESEWGEPINLGPHVNTAQSEGGPYLSSDGSELYFDRGDIWDRDTYDVWRVPVILPPAADALRAGDADQNDSFDQLDIVRVLQAGKYLTGEPATWGEGDWNGAPGGSVGNPPAGDGSFDQLDIIKALASGFYLSGPHATIAQGGTQNDDHTSIVYNAITGEVEVDAPAGHALTSVIIDSAAGIFTGEPVQNLVGSFDNDADNNIFKATFGSSFGSITFGLVAQLALSEEFVAGDLTIVGSLEGGGNLGEVDLIYIPEPSTMALLALGLVGALLMPRRQRS